MAASLASQAATLTSLEVTLEQDAAADFQGSRRTQKSAVLGLLPQACRQLVVKGHLLENNTKLYVLVRSTDESILSQISHSLAPKGLVTRMTIESHRARLQQDESFGQSREAQSKGILGAKEAKATIDSLLELRGTGGSKKRRRKAADAALAVLATGQEWSACASKELQQRERKAEASEDEDE